MVCLPAEIMRDIVRRVGNEGYRYLAAFIVSGKDGNKAVFQDEVLQEVDLDEFVFVSSLANEGSIYRSFFMKCFNAGNETAKYVEGLRLAVKFGPSDRSLELLHGAKEYVIYAYFAAGVFSICAGDFDLGITTLRTLSSRVGWLDQVVEIGETVMAQIADIDPPLAGLYNGTFRYTQFDIPECVYICCSMNDVCFECLPYWYSRRVRDLC